MVVLVFDGDSFGLCLFGWLLVFCFVALALVCCLGLEVCGRILCCLLTCFLDGVDFCGLLCLEG